MSELLLQLFQNQYLSVISGGVSGILLHGLHNVCLTGEASSRIR
jgi:hypothetical protein